MDSLLCTDKARQDAGSTTGRFAYDLKVRSSFNPGENQLKEFMHLKGHINEHLNGSKHVGNWKKFLVQVLETRQVQID